jgi:hypothetical protein
MYFKELGCSSLSLPFSSRFYNKSYNELQINPSEVFCYRNIFDRFEIPYQIISPKVTLESAYSNYSFGSKHKTGFENHADFFKTLDKVLMNEIESVRKKQNFIYAYYPYFDEFSHIYGTESGNCRDLYKKIETSMEKMHNKFKDSGTLFILTADHGLMNIKAENKLNLHNYPELRSCLSMPLSGEGRVPFCYVRPSKLSYFRNKIENEFSEYCDMISIEEAQEMELFGTGKASSKFFERVGDYILLMKDGYIMTDSVLNEKSHPFIGYHGGLSAEELYVPLVTF